MPQPILSPELTAELAPATLLVRGGSERSAYDETSEALFLTSGFVYGSAAEAEFQKIVDHSGMVWNCWTGALARLGLARAYALQAQSAQGADGDAARAKARAAYKDFLDLWRDADPDVPILKQAKKEYRKIEN